MSDAEAALRERILAHAVDGRLMPKHVDAAVEAANAAGASIDELVALARVGARLLKERAPVAPFTPAAAATPVTPVSQSPSSPLPTQASNARGWRAAAIAIAIAIAVTAVGGVWLAGRRAPPRSKLPTVTYRDGRKCRLSNVRFRYSFLEMHGEPGPIGEAASVDLVERAADQADLDIAGRNGHFARDDLRRFRFYPGPQPGRRTIDRIEIDTDSRGTSVFQAVGERTIRADLFTVFARGQRPPPGMEAQVYIVADSTDAECRSPVIVPLSSAFGDAVVRVDLR